MQFVLISAFKMVARSKKKRVIPTMNLICAMLTDVVLAEMVGTLQGSAVV